MLIPKQNRKRIYESLFKEGVLVAKKDFNAPKHQDIEVPNLHVIKACQSLNSKGYVKTQFSWQYYYYSLTNEGIEYLREYLHLPQEIVPATFKKQARQPNRRPELEGGREGGAYRPPQGRDRDYRRRDDGGEGKKEGASGDFRPEFRGYGRGRGRVD
ncbi:7613_t:CDS:2 [Cetraspora pellucida]|uniref:7613_t:CDS:1 n=1 Tax=Cetraspora pellucida TaxID=1433469 RepID=A0ACA9NRF7_9GLOM|nr:7613_t:CDS:2 [Cetraspora pellucida]